MIKWQCLSPRAPHVTIPQFDSDIYPDPYLTPELCLLAAVVQMALRDLQKRWHQAEAQAVIEAEELELFCEWLDWDVDVIRQAVAEGWRPRDGRQR